MTEETQQSSSSNSEDQLNTGLTILSFCIPLAGAIIYFSNKDASPNKANSACHAALWGFGIGVVLNILSAMIPVDNELKYEGGQTRILQK